jgi:hypothetical protein
MGRAPRTRHSVVPRRSALTLAHRPVGRWAQEDAMLMTILIILGILWLLGFSLHVGGALIHL